MRSFFIDLENVRSYGLEGILLLKPEDKVYVFYSDNANTLTIPTIESLNESSAQVKYIKTNYIGANAMDFQIVTLLGASIEKERAGQFYIISHDNGFKSAVKFCEGYFTGYEIVTGVFANILQAINSENGKSIAQAPAPEVSVSVKSENPAAQKKSRNRRKKRGGQNPAAENAAETPAVKESTSENRKENVNIKPAATPANTNAAKPADSSDQPAADNEPGKSKGRNRRRRGAKPAANPSNVEVKAEIEPKDNKQKDNNPKDNKSKDNKPKDNKPKDNKPKDNKPKDNKPKDNGTKNNKQPNESKPAQKPVQNPVQKPVNNAQGSNGKGSYKYVYNALSDFLSQNTIDMYAATIDEGIRKSANRNELHEFFKKSYGADEAEALYKIIYSDFEKMKKESGK